MTRALAFQRGTLALLAEQVSPIDEGWVVRQSSLPLVWALNEVRVTRAIDYAGALAVAEWYLGDLPYRQLLVEHEASGQRLEGSFRADGWEVGREIVMDLTRAPDPEVDTSGVVEADEDDALELMRRWLREDPDLDETPDGLDQLREFNGLTWRAQSAKRLGVIGADGALAAMTMLYSDGVTAQVEDVYTVPEQRRRGFGRALVTHAAALARQAGHELVFIVADDEGWPKQLYARIGFEPIGRTWVFHRKAEGL